MAENTPPRLNARKIYLKDASFESPVSPGVFLQQNIQPNIDLNINVVHQQIDEEGKYFEVTLQVTSTATQDKSTMFLVEIHQAGIFEINADDETQRNLLIEVGCPHMLLPFAREELASLVTKGGFPQLLINPINFEAVYKQKLAAAESKEDEETEGPIESEGPRTIQ
jgi:preprotein translocase subunit SecB